METKIDELKEKIIPVVEKWEIPEVYLFGSYARNEADETSDVDIAIETEDSKINTLFSLVEFQEELEYTLNKPVDVASLDVILKEQDMLYKKLLKQEFERDKVKLYERTA